MDDIICDLVNFTVGREENILPVDPVIENICSADVMVDHRMQRNLGLRPLVVQGPEGPLTFAGAQNRTVQPVQLRTANGVPKLEGRSSA